MYFLRARTFIIAFLFSPFILVAGTFAQSTSLEEAAIRYNENYVRAATAQNEGNPVDAEIWHRKNVKLVDETTGVPPEIRVQARFNLASAMILQDKLVGAKTVLDEAQLIASATDNLDPIDEAFLMSNRGSLYLKLGNISMAATLLNESRNILEATRIFMNIPAHFSSLLSDRSRTQLSSQKVSSLQ